VRESAWWSSGRAPAPPGTFDAVRDGLVDVSFVTASYTPARHILPLIAELPGAGDTALANSVVFRGVMPFMLADVVRLILLLAFPILALWLPGFMR
jgi:TRAP-type mannitol/chloroaromatic compound transport system permease large subunit